MGCSAAAAAAVVAVDNVVAAADGDDEYNNDDEAASAAQHAPGHLRNCSQSRFADKGERGAEEGVWWVQCRI